MRFALLTDPYFKRKGLMLFLILLTSFAFFIIIGSTSVVERMLTATQKAEDASLDSRIALYRAGFRKLWNPGRLIRGTTLGALSGITAVLFHSAVDFNLHIPANAILFTVLAAVVAAPIPRIRKNHSFPKGGALMKQYLTPERIIKTAIFMHTEWGLTLQKMNSDTGKLSGRRR